MNPTPTTRLPCRFQTLPPIPPLKAVIGVSPDWSIEYFVSKIHETILRETSGDECLHLLQPPNPSHRLILELPDGCRLTTNEPCAIIDREQLLTVRLAPKPQFSQLAPFDLTQVTSTQSNYPTLAPSPIHSFERFAYHASPSSDHPNASTSSSNPTLRIRANPPDIFSSQSTSQTQSDAEPNPPNLSSPVANEANHNSNSHLSPEPPIVQPVHQTAFPFGGSLASNHIAPNLLSNHPPDHNLANSAQNVQPSNNISTESSFQCPNSNPTPPEGQNLASQCPPPTEDVKPNPQGLNGAVHHENASEAEIPWVRSHIAGVRKSAARHYFPSSSSSSSDEDDFLDSSDDALCFSRFAQNLRSRRRGREKQKSQTSKRTSLQAVEKRPSKSPDPKRNIVPIEIPSESAVAETNSPHPSTTIVSNSASEKRRASSELVNPPKRSANHDRSHQIPPSSPPPPEAVTQVRVVIPSSQPPLSSLPRSERKHRKVEVGSKGRKKSQPKPSTPNDNDSSYQPINPPSRQNKIMTRSPKRDSTISPSRSPRSVYQIYIDDYLFKAASARGPARIPYSKSGGLNDDSTLMDVIKRMHLDLNASWKMIIGNKVWLSHASLDRIKSRRRPWGLLEGRSVQLDFDLTLRHLGVYPHTHSSYIHVIRNWDR